MKMLTILVLSVFTFNLFASDGVECYKRAKKEIEFPKELPEFNAEFYISLCEGAKSTAPVDCYKEAKEELKNAPQTAMSLNGMIFALCTHAESTEPVDCLKVAKKELIGTDKGFNIYSALRLCGHKIN